MTMIEFARSIHQTVLTDRGVNITVTGATGEGKSTFSTQLLKAYGRVAHVPWSFKQMTWSRKELLLWIDGEKDSKKDASGLRKGQLPERSGILIDELFSMFYKRNWHDVGQIDGIATLNMCRDRHLVLVGNNPKFFDLDKGLLAQMNYHCYIPKRGIAHVFMQEENAHNPDNWNSQENMKLYRKYHNYNKCIGYVGFILFGDWNDEEKKQYLIIRNEKRLHAIDDNKGVRIERYSKIKQQRDALIRYCYLNGGLNQNFISGITGLEPGSVSEIINGKKQ